MRILLSPETDNRLSSIYEQALDEATNLYVASAYLTAWDPPGALNSKCSQITFLVGTDFGITRKAALYEVLRWLPCDIPSLFAAVSMPNGGFHPKVMVWTNPKGRKFSLIGSSNLSRAAFTANCEANVLLELADSEYVEITNWLEQMAAGAEPITSSWVEHHYVEAGVGPAPPDGGLDLPSADRFSACSDGFDADIRPLIRTIRMAMLYSDSSCHYLVS